MAVAPLFMSSMADLRSRMRLSNVVNSGANAVIDTAVQEARIWLYGKLGSDTVTTVLGYTISDNPSTSVELCRGAANKAEEHYIRYTLYRLLPALFLDDQGERFRKMNDELGHSPENLDKARAEELRLAESSITMCLSLVASTAVEVVDVNIEVLGGTSTASLGSTLGLYERGGLL